MDMIWQASLSHSSRTMALKVAVNCRAYLIYIMWIRKGDASRPGSSKWEAFAGGVRIHPIQSSSQCTNPDN